jgi:predicted nucleic acid-binding protein
MHVFIDTSYFFARLVKGDQWHRQASAAAAVQTTAATMWSLSIRRAFTFDEHFRAAGFETLR